MANSFTITITAVDKATAVIRGVRESVNKFTAPVTDLGKAFKSLGKEAGIDKIAKTFGGMKKSIGEATEAASRFIPELAPLAGLGLAGGIIATAGAIAALTNKWANFGFSVKQTAISLDTSTMNVQAWRGAASQMGIDAQTTDASLQSLQDTIEGARFGRNQTALVTMNQLGLKFRYLKSGALDVNDALLQIAGAMERFKNPSAQRLIAQNLGVSGLLPVLRQGRAKTKAYLDDAAKGAVPDADLDRANAVYAGIAKARLKIGQWLYRLPGAMINRAANPSAGGLNALQLANPIDALLEPMFERLGRSARAAAAPFARNFIEGVVAGFRELPAALRVATTVVKALGGDAITILRYDWTAVKSFFGQLWEDIDGSFEHGLGRVSDALGQVKTLAGGFATWVAHGVRGAVDGVVQAGRDAASAVGGWFHDQGRQLSQMYSPDQIKGIAAGLYAESKLNPGIKNPTSSAYGIGQWLTPRQRDFQRVIGHDIHGSTLAEQTRFLAWELSHTLRRAGANIKAQPTQEGAMIAFLRDFEAPGPGLAGDIARGRAALKAGPDSLLSMMAAGTAHPDGQGAPGSPNGKLHVEVQVKHNGDSARVRSKRSGDDFFTTMARVEQSMLDIAA